MFTFQFTLVPGIPRLAWLLKLEKSSSLAHLFHGEWVETREDSFFEGSWAGPFESTGFDSEFMTGSGAKIRDGSLMLVAPNHTLDRICVLAKGKTTFVSNSLPLILAGSEERLDDEFLFYDSYIASIRQGLHSYERAIPTRSRNSVFFYYCANVLVNEGCEFREESKKTSPTFSSYQAYRGYVDNTIRQIVSNAADRARKVRYSPLTTISRGYDSPAVAVLAQSAGCSRAITFRESRRETRGEDCGTEIANLLGLSVQEFGRLDYRDNQEFLEAKNSGGPSEFLSFGQNLRGTLLFTGFHGGGVWDKKADSVSTVLIRADASGTSLTDYRLEVGFVHLPVPFIGADSHPSIYAISNSQDMTRWAVGGTYDRPIPRRIVEEAGIPRHMFGQKKRAAGVVVTAEGLDKTMSEPSLKDFQRFVSERWNVRSLLITSWYRGIKKIISYNERLRRIGARVLGLVGIRGAGVPLFVSKRLRLLAFGYIGKESLLFHWGVGKLVEQYRASLSARI